MKKNQHGLHTNTAGTMAATAATVLVGMLAATGTISINANPAKNRKSSPPNWSRG
jgi:hypothetical protein